MALSQRSITIRSDWQNEPTCRPVEQPGNISTLSVGRSAVDSELDLSGTFVVVPAYNEAHMIASVIEDLRQVVPVTRIIVVDDGSDDATANIAGSFGAITIRHAINRGQGAALATGIEYALNHKSAAVIVTFDGDGQHQAQEIPELVRPILEGTTEVVLGTRFSGKRASGIRKSRILTLKLGVIFTRMVSGIRVSDCHNGFRAFSRKAAQQIRISQDGMTHASEILDEVMRNRLPYLEHPVQICYTDYSRCKGQRSGQAFELAIKFLMSRLLR